MGDFYSFEDVLSELKIDESELKKMVSEGEIRAFRSENKMKFKKEDIERLRRDKTGTHSKVSSSESGQNTSVTDLSQTDDILIEELSEEAVSQTEIPTESAGDTLQAAEDVQLEESPSESTSEFELPTPTEVDLEPVSPSKVVKSRKFASRKPVVIEEKKSSLLWIIVLFLTTATLLYTSFVVYEWVSFDRSPLHKSAVSKGIKQWFLEKFWTDDEWKNYHESRINKDKSGQPIYPSRIMKYETTAGDSTSE